MIFSILKCRFAIAANSPIPETHFLYMLKSVAFRKLCFWFFMYTEVEGNLLRISANDVVYPKCFRFKTK